MLEVKNLSIALKHNPSHKLVDGVSFSLEENQCLGILGESGSGKSLSCNAINGLLGSDFLVSGEVLFQGQNLLLMPDSERRKMRGATIAMVMQSPMTAFDPLFSIGSQAVETILQHKAVSEKDAAALFASMLERVNLNAGAALLNKYPHELSGGMLQRIMVALALVLEPKLIIADEPTTAIDYISQQEVVKELKFMREQFGTSLIFVSHDLSLVAHLADEVLVMHQGQVQEFGETKQVFNAPTSEYTRYLIDTRQTLINRFRAIMEAN